MSETQAADIFNCILDKGPITAEQIVAETHWIRHVVDLVISLLLERGFIQQCGETDDQWHDPLYKVTTRENQR